ncbi:hypothetical protein [Rhodococcoides yunnanense]|uniref:hypothetical protein n=1 Tax=Rhodococcoides yunnanense TaxID=278209 RepID=UPI0022B21A31|nr:hypothetical protein [Rhodococcus yunnanensis]MCZ4278529.1 hypothetical protein [Rhodococcus yunnanensis]
MTEPEPWRRSKTPAPLPSNSADARAISKLTDPELAAIIRDNLLPRSNTAGDTANWRAFWNTLTFDPQLNDRANAIIDVYVEQAAAALDTGELDDAQYKRAGKFHDLCIHALDRLDKVVDDPLAWAGARAAGFNPRSREVINTLVQAIAEHRDDGDDAKLWAILAEVRLDPGHRRR